MIRTLNSVTAQIHHFPMFCLLALSTLLGSCADGDGDAAARCEGDNVVFPDGTRLDCAQFNAFCMSPESGEAECTTIQGGGPHNVDGTPRFLTLPLDYDAVVRNGWQYNFAGNGAGHAHGSIDYQADAGTTVYAACSGVAMSSSQYAKGLGYGRFVIIRCDASDANGNRFHVINAHLSEAEAFIPKLDRWNQEHGKWAAVTQGDVIGKSGSDDTSWPHLHFQVQTGHYAGPSVDAYDLYATTVSAGHSAEQEYPPSGSRYVGCGPNYLWTMCPPTVAPSCTCSGRIDSANVAGSTLHVAGSVACSAGIEKWSIVAHDAIVYSRLEDGQKSADFMESVDVAGQNFPKGDAPVGLWVKEVGQAQGCLVDDTVVTIGGGGCNGETGFKCIGNVVHAVDECGNSSGVVEDCGDERTCVGVSPTEAACQAVPETCGNGGVDGGEQCDGAMFGGKTCDDFGWPDGELACTAACTISTANCCECSSGPCCDGCNLQSPAVVCDPQAESEYDCTATGCGADVTLRTRGRLCSGVSSACDGDLGPWNAAEVYDDCDDTQTCSPGDSSCNAGQSTYDVSEYECATFSTANGSGAGGGEIFRICSSVDSQTGAVTVKARKHDGSTFGSRPYQVRVSPVQDAPCGPATSHYFVSDDAPSGVGGNELTFTFDSVWEEGQTEKGYCVTASTKQGDLGYDANNPEQASWWWSEKTVVTRQCM